MQTGIWERKFDSTPVAVIDIETTGLTAGLDRAVEIAIIRSDESGDEKVVMDTLVNPQRKVAATEIHGIVDEDVFDAPCFSEIVGDVADALSGCVVSSYNIYFDMSFLKYEMSRAGFDSPIPHFCLMYMRPLLGLGKKCTLSEACRTQGVAHESSHISLSDARAASRLLTCYRIVTQRLGIKSYRDLSQMGRYKFFDSFGSDPIAEESSLHFARSKKFKSRSNAQRKTAPIDPVSCPTLMDTPLRSYWDELKVVLSDLDVSDEEVDRLERTRQFLGLSEERVRALHGRAFGSVIAQFTQDERIEENERTILRKLRNCLQRLGWAPGD